MTNFTGYPALVWQSCYDALLFLRSQLGGTPASSISAAETVFQTLLNGVEAIDASDLAAAWHSELCHLQQIQVLDLPVSPTDAAVFSTRAATYTAAQAALTAIIPPVPNPMMLLENGDAAIASTGLLAFFLTFNFEPPPAGLTPANLIAQAQAFATSLSNIAAAVAAYLGLNPTVLYDVAAREAAVAQNAATMLTNFTSGPFATINNVWDTLAALPALATCAGMLNTPATFASQQSAVIRNSLLTSAGQIATYLLALRGSPSQQVSVATLRNNESLMDFAARVLGNFELWTAVAAINGLQPPFVGATAAPGVAAWGSNLVLPTPGAQLSAAGDVPSYLLNFLGVDFYTGPINGSMPPWNGDYQLIVGYNNLRWALGRRVQTTLRTLVYHQAYGCRIPPLVGAIQDTKTAGNIAAYGKSALLSDPRVLTVPSATATLVEQGVEFDGTVQPAGFSTTIQVNEVIRP